MKRKGLGSVVWFLRRAGQMGLASEVPVDRDVLLVGGVEFRAYAVFDARRCALARRLGRLARSKRRRVRAWPLEKLRGGWLVRGGYVSDRKMRRTLARVARRERARRAA